jgi:protein-tyrosine phosphatase
MSGVIDLHCHVLPALDDGPASMSEALGMARVAAASATTVAVATPHINGHWRVSPAEIPRRADALRQSLAEAGIELEIRTGGEIALSRLVDLTPEELDSLRLGGGPYLLLECPLSPSAGDFDMLMLTLHRRGERILLAHPERSPLFQQEPERLVRLVEAGLLCSITTGSILGQFGQPARRLAIEMLRVGLAHDLASDCHDQRRRPPGLARALAHAERDLPGIGAQREWFTSLAPAAILGGEPLPPRPPLTGSAY